MPVLILRRTAGLACALRLLPGERLIGGRTGGPDGLATHGGGQDSKIK
jgi:hypothetical protein